MVTIEVTESQYKAIKIAMTMYLSNGENTTLCENLVKQMVQAMDVPWKLNGTVFKLNNLIGDE